MRITRALVLVLLFTLLVRWVGDQIILRHFGFAKAAFFFLPVYIALVWVGVARWGGIGLGELGWRFRGLDVLWGVLGLVALLAWLLPWAGGGVEELLAHIARIPPPARARFVVIGLTAAFLEETFFRGVLQGALRPRLGLGLAIAVQAVLFALSHLSIDPERLAVLTGFGVIFGALKGERRSLWAPATAHALLWILVGGL